MFRKITLSILFIFLMLPRATMDVGADTNTVYVNSGNVPGPGEGTLSDPFVKIQDGIDAASVGDTVQVFAGLYIENILMKSGVSVIGPGAELTTIIGTTSFGSSVVEFDDTVNATLSGFTITADAPRGIRGVTFVGQLIDHTARIERCLLIGIQYGIFVWSPATPTIENNTLAGRGLNEQGIYIGNGPTSPIVRNNIITGYDDGIRVVAGNIDPAPIIEYNNLWNNETNYVNYPDHTGINGNISADPLFTGSENFNLQSRSPAIDAGDPLSPLNLDGTRADMGAFPYTHSE